MKVKYYRAINFKKKITILQLLLTIMILIMRLLKSETNAAATTVAATTQAATTAAVTTAAGICIYLMYYSTLCMSNCHCDIINS